MNESSVISSSSSWAASWYWPRSNSSSPNWSRIASSSCPMTVRHKPSVTARPSAKLACGWRIQFQSWAREISAVKKISTTEAVAEIEKNLEKSPKRGAKVEESDQEEAA